MFSKLKWYKEWSEANPTNSYSGALKMLVGGGVVFFIALMVTYGENDIETVQTGPRGNAMGVVKYASDASATDMNADYVTSAPIVPVGGEALAKNARENVPEILGDLTVENYDRMLTSMRAWTGIDDLFAGDENYQSIVAARMIAMTQSLNEDWSDHVGAEAGVNCYTCHRGEPVPSGVWFNVTPVNLAVSGWSANQNRATDVSQSTSLPSDALEKYLADYNTIRVHDLESRVDNEGTATVQDTERTFSLMNYISNSLDVNCSYCHNTRAFYDLDQSTPQLGQSQLGIAMVQEINIDWLPEIADVLPAARLGTMHGDVPKVGCMTCHKGENKPLGGMSMIGDWPELRSTEPPTYD